jgi:hypothetical protein
MPALQPFARGLFVIEGPLVRDMGMMFDTRMVVATLADGSLWIDSPVVVPYPMLQQVADLGPIRFLLAPTPRHLWRLSAWHRLFPEAELWACRRTLATLRPESPLPLKGILSDQPGPGWAADFEQQPVKGSRAIEEVLFLHKPSRTLIVEDLIQVHFPSRGHPFRNSLIRFGGVAAPYGGTALDIQLTFWDREAARRSLDRVLGWDFDKLIIAHGPCLQTGAKAYVERAFAWLQR